jgi:hypothetical protein
MARKENDEGLIAHAELVRADVLLQSHMPQLARSCAQAANAYFARKGQKDSEWQSLLYLAEASKSLGDSEEGSDVAKKALDILGGLEQSWSPAVFDKYSKRPDYQLAIKQLLLIKEERGTSPHDRAPGY